MSKQSKTLVTIELTVPLEENCEEACERKSLTYADLMEDCRDKGWSVWLFPVEVGYRRFRSTIGVEARCTTRNIRRACNTAVRRSCRTVILLDMAPPRRSVLEVGIRLVVDWPPLLTRQLKDVMV